MNEYRTATDELTYPDLKAPAQDPDVLLWPDAKAFFGDSRDNARHLQGSHHILLQNVPLPEVRAAARQWAGYDPTRLLIATGHQTELYHAGVWAKEALISAAAKALDGQSCHVAVDTDSPKHLSLRWPGASFPITDDPRLLDAAWSGELKGPSPAHIRQIETALHQAQRDWTFEPVADQFLQSLLALAPHEPDLSPAIAQSMQDLDRSLGVDNHWLLVSPLLASEPYLLFVHHLLSRAAEFAGQYNAALAGYRAQHKIRSKSRPMPDLNVSDQVCETPFWLDGLAEGSRDRAQVMLRNGICFLEAPNGDALELNPDIDGWRGARDLQQFCRSHQLRLSPRALTLTLFLRLCLADQFVHGIGGGQYDQVTDRIIAVHFHLAPPRFAVTTATLYFPGAAEQPRACLPCVAHQGHQLKHRIMGQEKMAMVSSIAQLPRNSPDRQLAFGRMHGRLAALQLDHPVIRQWEQQFRAAREQSAQEQTIFDRELFYGIQSRQRLVDVAEQYHHLCASF